MRNEQKLEPKAINPKETVRVVHPKTGKTTTIKNVGYVRVYWNPDDGSLKTDEGESNVLILENE